MAGSGNNVLLDDYSNTTGASFHVRRARGTAGSPSNLSAGDEMAGFGARGYGGGFATSSTGSLKIYASEAFTSSTMGTYLTLNTTLNGSTTSAERPRIDNTGNVGIGTATPLAVLHVESSTVSLHNATPLAGPAIMFNGYTSSGDKYIGAQDAFEIWQDFTSGALKFGAAPPGAANGAITFTTALTIKDSGNVGSGIALA